MDVGASQNRSVEKVLLQNLTGFSGKMNALFCREMFTAVRALPASNDQKMSRTRPFHPILTRHLAKMLPSRKKY